MCSPVTWPASAVSTYVRVNCERPGQIIRPGATSGDHQRSRRRTSRVREDVRFHPGGNSGIRYADDGPNLCPVPKFRTSRGSSPPRSSTSMAESARRSEARSRRGRNGATLWRKAFIPRDLARVMPGRDTRSSACRGNAAFGGVALTADCSLLTTDS